MKRWERIAPWPLAAVENHRGTGIAWILWRRAAVAVLVWTLLLLPAQAAEVQVRSNRPQYTQGEGIYLEAALTGETGGAAWYWECRLPGEAGFAPMPSAPQQTLFFTAEPGYDGAQLRAVATLADGTLLRSAALTLRILPYCTGIRLHMPPHTREYVIGQSFDPAGGVVYADYSDGSTDDVTAGCTWSPERLDTPGTCRIAAACRLLGKNGEMQAFSCETSVQVRQAQALPPVIRRQPQDGGKTGALCLTVEAESPDGGLLRYAWYGGWTTALEDLTLVPGATGASYVPRSAEDDTYYIVAVYNQKDGVESEPVFSRAARVPGRSQADRLILLELPRRLRYVRGEQLELAGLRLAVEHPDGSREEIFSGYTCSEALLDIAGLQVVTVFYGTASAAFAVEVLEEEVPEQDVPPPEQDGAEQRPEEDSPDVPDALPPEDNIPQTPQTQPEAQAPAHGTGQWIPLALVSLLTGAVGGVAVWKAGGCRKRKKQRERR